jgi:hypothetical protein
MKQPIGYDADIGWKPFQKTVGPVFGIVQFLLHSATRPASGGRFGRCFQGTPAIKYLVDDRIDPL